MASCIIAQETATIRVPVRLVTVPALVFSSDNRLIPDLHMSNFRVLDNGREQSIRMEAAAAPVSIAVVIQVNQDVRQYVPFIAKTGSVINALVAGESGEAAVIAYSDEVSVIQPFHAGGVSSAFKTISSAGKSARMIDAAARAVKLLAERPRANSRILLLIGQPIDNGSESTLDSLREHVERENVRVFGLTLPLLGKSFVSDTFYLQGVTKAERGGYRAGVDLGNLVAVLSRKADTSAAADPWTTLTAASGGTQLGFRTQRQLEDRMNTIGLQVRSAYLLSYYPGSTEPGYHSVRVEVNLPGVKVYSRPGYWLGAN
jgi:VWFA-related protein